MRPCRGRDRYTSTTCPGPSQHRSRLINLIPYQHTELEDGLKELSAALGGDYVPSPLWSPPLRTLLTAHPLGGCAAAGDPDDGVVNAYGEVHGYPELYLVDASTIPTLLARNPTATICALAERAAFHLIHGREMAPGDPQTPGNHVQEEAREHG